MYYLVLLECVLHKTRGLISCRLVIFGWMLLGRTTLRLAPQNPCADRLKTSVDILTRHVTKLKLQYHNINRGIRVCIMNYVYDLNECTILSYWSVYFISERPDFMPACKIGVDDAKKDLSKTQRVEISSLKPLDRPSKDISWSRQSKRGEASERGLISFLLATCTKYFTWMQLGIE